MSTPTNPWQRLSSQIVYKNRWYAVRRDEVITPDGKPGEYNVVEVADGVFIVAIDDDDQLFLIEKYRYTTDVYGLEIPAGGVDNGESLLDAAKRELQEELGMHARDWQEVGSFQSENAYMNSFGHVFVARGLSKAGSHDQLAEGITGSRKVTFKEALQLVAAGEISDCQSHSALMFAGLKLGLLDS